MNGAKITANSSGHLKVALVPIHLAQAQLKGTHLANGFVDISDICWEIHIYALSLGCPRASLCGLRGYFGAAQKWHSSAASESIEKDSRRCYERSYLAQLWQLPINLEIPRRISLQILDRGEKNVLSTIPPKTNKTAT